MTNLAALEKRLCLVERGFLSRSTDCCCRPGGETNYHTATELERIMNVRCAVHQFRDLGSICWVPSGTPLLLEDRSLCECPPSLTRDLLAGKHNRKKSATSGVKSSAKKRSKISALGNHA